MVLPARALSELARVLQTGAGASLTAEVRENLISFRISPSRARGIGRG